MKITERDLATVNRSKRKKPRGQGKQKSKFVKLCEKYRRHPTTIQRRIRPVAEGGQGMSLKQALRTDPLDHRSCGRLGKERSSFCVIDPEHLPPEFLERGSKRG